MTDTSDPEIERLFEWFFVASRTPGKAGEKATIRIKEAFPKSGEELLAAHPKLEEFCFPETAKTALKTTRFTYTLTDKHGNWLYGFCVRNSQQKRTSNDCLCVLSKYPWFGLFYEVLGYADLQYSCRQRPTVIYKLFDTHPVPAPGARFAVTSEERDHRFYVTRPPDIFPLLDAPIPEFIEAFGVSNCIDVFAALLSEQRILLVGDDLELVTGCIHALTAIIHPFQYQYPFVPILPPGMLDALCSPTPFVMGIHSDVLHQAASLPTESVVMADTRNGTITGLAPDRIPLPACGRLKDRIKEVLNSKGKTRFDKCRGVLMHFTDFFAATLGNIREFPMQVKNRKGDYMNNFDDDKFVKSWQHDKRSYSFARTIVQTQMFQVWKEKFADIWMEQRYDLFAERAALKFPELWPGYYKEQPKSKSEGFLSRFGRAKNKVKKEIDKKLKDKKSAIPDPPAYIPNNDNKDSPNLSPRDTTSGASTPDARSSPVSQLAVTSWLDAKTTPVANQVQLPSGYPGDFVTLHESLDPFAIHVTNPYRRKSTSEVVRQQRDPTTGYEQSSLFITKVNGKIGCSYKGNIVTTVVKNGAADISGMVPGMRMIFYNGSPVPDESYTVKSILDSAPQKFNLVVIYPPGVKAKHVDPTPPTAASAITDIDAIFDAPPITQQATASQQQDPFTTQ
eukprot:TRINITY_DN1444_c3_g1_i1.p1 TRINITY_DN1444_c3_g1~~TRINITY_DN1444_c3_g1_i1.p1  ORF type:complete len:677 (+),score=88.39 TRINITY_DN1444_c3_g1_i1:119-2149(+)